MSSLFNLAFSNITTVEAIKETTIQSLLRQKKETFKCTSNMKPVGGKAISCLTIWFHGQQEAVPSSLIIIFTIIQKTFIQSGISRQSAQPNLFLSFSVTHCQFLLKKWVFQMQKHEARACQYHMATYYLTIIFNLLPLNELIRICFTQLPSTKIQIAECFCIELSARTV